MTCHMFTERSGNPRPLAMRTSSRLRRKTTLRDKVQITSAAKQMAPAPERIRALALAVKTPKTVLGRRLAERQDVATVPEMKPGENPLPSRRWTVCKRVLTRVETCTEAHFCAAVACCDNKFTSRMFICPCAQNPCEKTQMIQEPRALPH